MNRFKKILLAVWMFILKVKDYVRIDGLLHIMACYITYDIADTLFPWWFALVITLVIIAWKEIYDRISGEGSAEWHDVYCGLAGLLLSMIINLLP